MNSDFFLIIISLLFLVVVTFAAFSPIYLLNRFLKKRVAGWNVSRTVAFLRIALIAFAPLLFILLLAGTYSAFDLTGNISWTDSSHSASPRDEMVWNGFILLMAVWPLLLIYGIGGYILTARHYRAFKSISANV